MLQNYSEAMDEVRDRVFDYEGSTFEEFFNDVFNTERNIGIKQAADDCAKFYNDPEGDPIETMLNGVWGAQEFVKKYEESNYGSVSTDLLNPEKVADAIDYIRAENDFQDFLEEHEVEEDDTIDSDFLDEVAKENEEIKKERLAKQN